MWELMEYEVQEADADFLVVSIRMRVAQMRQMLHNPKSKFTEAQRVEINAMIDTLEAQANNLANRHDDADPAEEVSMIAAVGSVIIMAIFAIGGLLVWLG